jgi:NAD(P)-dependent dehydrogenase (short-subunit alcohol dehydrogenase family)
MPATITSAITAQSVWFITGCSTGFGREMAKQLLAHGNKVVVTARNPKSLTEFAGMENALVQKLDVTDPTEVTAAVQAAEAHFGRIDVLVNNAGIGYFAAVEEGEDGEIRRMFDINLFGLAATTRAVLPGMRKRRQGFIVNLSSIGGLRSFPAIGWYNATKFAVEGLSEALWQEVEPLGIRVMLVEPSGFRTDWAGRSADESKVQIADYAATAGAGRAGVRAVSGHQAGDPVRAVEALINAVQSKNPPHHLLLGNDSYDGAMAKLAELKRDFATWEAVSRWVDFPKDDVPKAGTHRAA